MQNTVFVIGAGAGHDIDMPLGHDLKEKISETFRVLHNPSSSNISFSEDINQLFRAFHSQLGHKISGIFPRIIAGLASTSSIDNYIHSQVGDKEIEICSKLAIANSILNSERQSKLQTENLSSFRDNMPTDWQYEIEQTWLPKFFEYLTQNQPFDSLSSCFQCISIINFNYDRCVEHYLYHNLKAFYRKQDEEVIKLLGDLKIFHPYGRLGRLIWEEGNEPLVRFGAESDANILIEILHQIKTFRESIDTSNTEHQDMLNVIRTSTRHVFLGFHYHDQNMELLGYDRKRKSNDSRSYYGTAIKMSEQNLAVIRQRLKQYSINPSMSEINFEKNHDCRKLLDDYWLPLSQ